MRQSDPRRPVSVALIAICLLMLVSAGALWGCQPLLSQGLPGGPATQPAEAAATPLAIPVQPTTTVPSPTPVTLDPSTTPVATPSATSVPGTKPSRMLIPDLKLDVPVADMTWKVVNTDAGPQSEWEVPEYAAGWAINSALLGEPNNVVLSGHNNIFGRVFMAISQAWPTGGIEKVDSFTERTSILNGRPIEMVGADGRRFNYVITGFYRIKDSGVPLNQRLDNGKWMDPTGHAQLTITTCWPPWSNTHRLIVVAEPAP